MNVQFKNPVNACVINNKRLHVQGTQFYNLGKIDEYILDIVRNVVIDVINIVVNVRKLNYFTMDGRILFDIQNVFRKCIHSLDSYKLDNVASH